MGESIKAICALLLIVSTLAALVAWFDDRPSTIAWGCRIVSPLVAVGCLGLLIGLMNRRDRAPDLLGRVVTEYFNRNGFCFAPGVESRDAQCVFKLLFQNQHDQPCTARVALRPARGFWLNRAEIEEVRFDVECEPAAFGVATVRVGLPAVLQGQTQRFEVGASAEYPLGRGERLRYRDGVFARYDDTFSSTFRRGLVLFGLLGGRIVLSKPPSVMLKLPSDVDDETPRDDLATCKTLWRLGDPMPKAAPIAAHDANA